MSRKEQVSNLLGILALALITGIGLYIGGATAAAAMAGSGIHLTSSIVQAGNVKLKERWLSSNYGILNHDIQLALVRAFIKALTHLETEYFKLGKASALPNNERESIKALFKELRENAQEVFLLSLIKPVDEQEVKHFLYGRQESATDRLWERIDGTHLLHTYGGHFREFLHRNLLNQVQDWFNEELKGKSDECIKAQWAFQQLLLEGIQADVKAVQEDVQNVSRTTQRTEEKVDIFLDAFRRLPNYDKPDFVKQMIKSPIPWGETNHSKYVIELKPVSEEWNTEIETAVFLYFKAYVDKIDRIVQIKEDSGSANFVILSHPQPILFRVNKRLNEENAIKAIVSLSEYFEQKKVLPDSPVRDYIVPLRGSKPFPQGCPGIWNLEDKMGYLTAYHYVDNAVHYSGRFEHELRSVATEFARFQAALTVRSETTPLIDLGPLIFPRKDLSYDQSHPAQKYEEYKTKFMNDNTTMDIYDIPHGLLKNSDKILKHAKERLEGATFLWESRGKTRGCAAYLDFHPHNTLVDRNSGKCLLIYDFESCLPQFNQDASLSFALHRFTREYIRQQGSPDKNKVKEARDIFLSAYAEGGGYVPADFTERLPALIRWVNLHKLFYIYGVFLRENSDFTKRLPLTKWEEMRKFIMYIQEADYYEDA